MRPWSCLHGRRAGSSRRAMAGVLLALAALPACADGDGGGGEASGPAPRPQTHGHPALPAEATRTVEVRMGDDMRFEPAVVTVAPGEVVAFRLTNAGELPHEFTIGGPDAQELHGYEMAAAALEELDDGGGHSKHGGPAPKTRSRAPDPERVAALEEKASASESVHLAPGETADVSWAFTGEETPIYGCHIPGHWGAGMRGETSPS